MRSRYEQFAATIFGIHRDIQKIERDEMESYGLKGAFAQYLLAMSHYPAGVTAAQLCEICDKNKAAVSRTLAEMKQSGLILQENSPSGYRANLQLSEAGKKAAAFVFHRASTAVELAGQGLTGDDRTVFYSALEGIAAHLQAISREGLPRFPSQQK